MANYFKGCRAPRGSTGATLKRRSEAGEVCGCCDYRRTEFIARPGKGQHAADAEPLFSDRATADVPSPTSRDRFLRGFEKENAGL